MQDANRARDARAGRLARIAALAGSVAAVSIAVIPSAIVHAEVLDPMRGYSFDGNQIGPTGPARGRDRPSREAPDRNDRADRADRAAPARAYQTNVSSGRIRRLAARQGFSLTSMPRRRGHAYFATLPKTVPGIASC